MMYIKKKLHMLVFGLQRGGGSNLQTPCILYFHFSPLIYYTKTSDRILTTLETIFSTAVMSFAYLILLLLPMYVSMSVCLSVCLCVRVCVCVCVYVCSHVEILFLNRFSSMIHQQTRIFSRKAFPKTNSKSNRMLKIYSAIFQPILQFGIRFA